MHTNQSIYQIPTTSARCNTKSKEVQHQPPTNTAIEPAAFAHSMVGSTGTIKTMRLLRGKSHKRDEAAAAAAVAATAMATAAAATPAPTTSTASAAAAAAASHSSNKNKRHNTSITSNTSSMSSASSASSASSTSASSAASSASDTPGGNGRHHYHQRSNSMRDHCLDMPWDGVTDDGHHPAIAYRQSPASVWVFPPLPPQPNIYICNNSQDALMQYERSGLKGFRKQFSGRFKRFVLRKPAEPAPAIPPELKCQLKSIYVY